MIVGQTVSAVGERTDRQTDLRIYYIDLFTFGLFPEKFRVFSFW